VLVRLRALWLLATALLVTLARRLLPRRSALARFYEAYGADGLREGAPGAAGREESGACVGCRLCEQVTPAASAGPGVLPLAALLQAGGRSLLAAPALARELAAYGPAERRRAAALCPFGVDVPAVLARLELGRDASATQRTMRS
jgi:hypothetical protein